MSIIEQAQAWAQQVQAEEQRRIGIIGIVCGIDRHAARAVYDEFVKAAKHIATVSVLSLDDALNGGWEVYHRALLGRTEATSAQTAAEQWLQAEAARRQWQGRWR